MTVDRARIEHAERLGKVLDGLTGTPVTIPVLAQRLGVGVKEAREALAELVKLERAARDDVGRYFRADAAPAQAATPAATPTRRRVVAPAAPAIPPTAPEATPATPPEAAATGGGRAPSKIHDVIHLLGTVPDREIAALVGLKRDTVKKWRKELGIKASGKRGGPRNANTGPLPFTAAGTIAAAPKAASTPAKAVAEVPQQSRSPEERVAHRAAWRAKRKAAAASAKATAQPPAATPVVAPPAAAVNGTARPAWLWIASYNRQGTVAEERVVAPDAHAAATLAASQPGTLLTIGRSSAVIVAG